MGSGLSSTHRSSLHHPAPARVIGADGSLREFPAPIPSSRVLGGSNNAARFFLCSCDALCFDADVPPLGADEPLRPGQIYFLLPASMLGRPLSPADMAALAVRASEALAARPRGLVRGIGIEKTRDASGGGGGGYSDGEVNEKLNQRTLRGVVTVAPPSPARNSKANNKLAVLARPLMKRALSTIEEVAE